MVNTSEKEFLSHIEAHKGIIHKISRMYTDTPEDREDLYQEMVLQLWRSYAAFDGQSKFSTWMYRVAVNTAITFLKKEKRRQHPATDILPDIRTDPPDMDAGSRLAFFYQAVRQLSPVEKALIFYFMEGLSHREIAAQLGITEVNTRVKLNRTKEKLQQIIKKNGYEF